MRSRNILVHLVEKRTKHLLLVEGLDLGNDITIGLMELAGGVRQKKILK